MLENGISIEILIMAKVKELPKVLLFNTKQPKLIAAAAHKMTTPSQTNDEEGKERSQQSPEKIQQSTMSTELHTDLLYSNTRIPETVRCNNKIILQQ